MACSISPFVFPTQLWMEKMTWLPSRLSHRSIPDVLRSPCWASPATLALATLIPHTPLGMLNDKTPSRLPPFSQRQCAYQRWGTSVGIPTVHTFHTSYLLGRWLNKSPMELLGLSKPPCHVTSKRVPLPAMTRTPRLCIKPSDSETTAHQMVTPSHTNTLIKSNRAHGRYVLYVRQLSPTMLVVVYCAGAVAVSFDKKEPLLASAPVHVISITKVDSPIAVQMPNKFSPTPIPALTAGVPNGDAKPHIITNKDKLIDNQHKEHADIGDPGDYSQICTTHFDPYGFEPVAVNPLWQPWTNDSTLSPVDMFYDETESDDEDDGPYLYTPLVRLAQDTLNYIQANAESTHTSGLDSLVPKLTDYLRGA